MVFTDARIAYFSGKHLVLTSGKMIHIRKAGPEEDSRLLANLANTIWREHYIPIIGKPQVDYMLENFQSQKAISRQIRDGVAYFVLEWDHEPVGYYAYEPRESECFLSKIYVLKDFRGKGLGKAAMKDLRDQAIAAGCKRITLTVNKDNSDSIAAYRKMGFRQGKPSIKDIGGGFIMDDYLMILEL